MPQRHHLPLNASANYWIAVKASAPMKDALLRNGYLAIKDGYYLLHAGAAWSGEWNRLKTVFNALPLAEPALVGIIPLETQPDSTEIEAHLLKQNEVQEIADSLWLGDALLNDQLMCYLQPIVDKERNVFGYEAFARAELDSDRVIEGSAIVHASRVLNIEYRLDRHLHHKAIAAFVEAGYQGHLFINFFSGFIHRPEVYLENLKKETRRYGIAPQNIVLDIIQPESQTNLSHLKSIGEYCRLEGYGIALDDMTSPRNVERLIHSLNPGFIKIDHALTTDLSSVESLAVVQQIVKLAHLKNIRVIGERIESEANFQLLKNANVDLFQGYYTGEPFPARASLHQAKATQ